MISQDEIIHERSEASMDRDTVIKWAREAGLTEVKVRPAAEVSISKAALERFATLVREDVVLKKAAEIYQEGYEAGQHDEREKAAEIAEFWGETHIAHELRNMK